MKTNEKASLQVLKITIITLILIFTCNIAVRAVNSKLNSVKIVLSNNYEMNVLTTKTKISEILEENHIIVLPDETVFPNTDTEITDNNTITISKSGSTNSQVIELANEEKSISKEQILGSYSNIVEKIETKEEVIPYETITKNSKTSSNDRTNKVITQGRDGLKEVTYKVKYQNDIEISRTVVKEKIIKKAVNKVIQITAKTSRSGEEIARKGSTEVATKVSNKNSIAKKVEGITPIVKNLNASAYTASTCGKKPGSKGYGITANGKKASSWYTVAAGKGYPMGTVIYIPSLKNKPNGGWFVVQDRGGAISNNRIDIYMNTYNECIKFGRKNIECYIYVK